MTYALKQKGKDLLLTVFNKQKRVRVLILHPLARNSKAVEQIIQECEVVLQH